MAGPLPGGDKQAMIDAYKGAQAQHAAPDADAAAEQAAGSPPDGDEGGMPSVSSDPELKSVQMQVQHLEHLLVAKGILMPNDLITPPSPAPPAGPMGAPPMAPPPGAPAPLQ